MIPRVGRYRRSDDNYMVLDSWLTPDFAREWLERGGLPKGQKTRYQHIARQEDWTGKGRTLVWRETRR